MCDWGGSLSRSACVCQARSTPLPLSPCPQLTPLSERRDGGKKRKERSRRGGGERSGTKGCREKETDDWEDINSREDVGMKSDEKGGIKGGGWGEESVIRGRGEGKGKTGELEGKERREKRDGWRRQKEVKIEEGNERIKGRREDGWKDEGGKRSKMELKIKGKWRDDGQRGNYIERVPLQKHVNERKLHSNHQMCENSNNPSWSNYSPPSPDPRLTSARRKQTAPFPQRSGLRVPSSRYCRKTNQNDKGAFPSNLFYVRFSAAKKITRVEDNSKRGGPGPGTFRGSIPRIPPAARRITLQAE